MVPEWPERVRVSELEPPQWVVDETVPPIGGVPLTTVTVADGDATGEPHPAFLS